MDRLFASLILLAVLTASLHADEKPLSKPGLSPSLSIAVAIPRGETGSARRIDFRDQKSHFHVVITNHSKRDQRVWEEWNMWGYRNLRFDVLNDDGKILHSIDKKDQIFTVNYPSWITLSPGDHFVFDVYFDRDGWNMPFLKRPESEGIFRLRLRAVYEVKGDDESTKNGVWIGRVESRTDDYTIGYFRGDNATNPESR